MWRDKIVKVDDEFPRVTEGIVKLGVRRKIVRGSEDLVWIM